MRSRIVILGLMLVTLGLPTVAALPPCLIQNINYTYPSTPVSVGQQITVKTEVQATCVQWPPYRGGVQYPRGPNGRYDGRRWFNNQLPSRILSNVH